MHFHVPKALKSVRYTLAGVNTLFLLTGIVLIATGAITLAQVSGYADLVTQRFFRLPTFALATGVIICIITVLGFYGALSEQFYFVAGYAAALLMVLVLEVALVISSYQLAGGARGEVRAPMAASRELYTTRLEVARLWDDLHREFECCGVAGRHDWGDRVPVSCCHIDYGTVSPFNCTTANAYEAGCLVPLSDWLSYEMNVLAVTAVVVTACQVLITAASGWLAWRTKFEEVELEM
ncbi:unnamed protein product [Plutella xylostella]|uniref:Tetraspanin n=1 Tax=Plutella xylostella TaxID=51655 RepID=A0A8S4DEE2_PLUXY|nr:unnamed protein product [Plutella xylostella]